MSFPDGLAEFEHHRWRWRALAGLLILSVAGLRIAYLLFVCPLDLAPDEAHYWDWSRHLDWSYYSKGPVVAYLIRGGCVLMGDDCVLGVRLPAIVCGSLLLVGLYVLTWQVYRSDRYALIVVALATTFPLVAAGSILMTIDSPYICCWTWALVFGYRAIFHGSAWNWLITGLLVGLGILAKYTMVLWLASASLFLLTTPAYRQLLFQRGFWIMTATAALCCLPILLWNMQHDWVGFRHVSGQAGLRRTENIRWLGPFIYVGTQFALLLGFWFVVWVAAMIAHRPWKESNPQLCYLWWMSAPMFCVFLFFSLLTIEEPNWPVAAYVSGLVLALGWVVRQFQSPLPWYRRFAATSLVGACLLGVLGIVIVHHSGWVQPVLLRISGPATPKQPMPLRRVDPTCRLRGWHTLARAVDQLRARLADCEPVIAAISWTIPGELSFYCAGHPIVYSLGPAVGERYSQYDCWRPGPLWDVEHFQGKTFIVVGPTSAVLREAFEQVDLPRTIVHQEQGQPVAQWDITICRGYRGFPRLPGWLQGKRF